MFVNNCIANRANLIAILIGEGDGRMLGLAEAM